MLPLELDGLGVGSDDTPLSGVSFSRFDGVPKSEPFDVDAAPFV